MLIFILISLILTIIFCIGMFYQLKEQNKTTHPHKSITPTYSVLTVKNCEDSIEGIIRSLAWQLSTSSIKTCELVVIDTGSDDKTFEILKKLSIEYDYIHPMHKSEYISFVTEL